MVDTRLVKSEGTYHKVVFRAFLPADFMEPKFPSKWIFWHPMECHILMQTAIISAKRHTTVLVFVCHKRSHVVYKHAHVQAYHTSLVLGGP